MSTETIRILLDILFFGIGFIGGLMLYVFFTGSENQQERKD